MTGSGVHLGPACRAFVRQLADHVERALARGELGHAAGCPACAGLLASAVGQAKLLKIRPSIPLALKSRDCYEAVLARAVEALEAAPAGAMLGQAAAVVPDASAIWPVPCEGSAVGRVLVDAGATPQVVPGWVWLRVKDRIRAEVVRRSATGARRRLSRAIAVAAALILGTLLVLPLARTHAPAGERNPIIVMQRMEHAPVIDYLPTAVLRHGGG